MIDPKTSEAFLSLCINIGFFFTTLSIFLAFIRVYIGPTLADRVLALDMMTVIIVTFCGLFAIYSSNPVFLNIAIVMALIGFLATVALARYAYRRALTQDDSGLGSTHK